MYDNYLHSSNTNAHPSRRQILALAGVTVGGVAGIGQAAAESDSKVSVEDLGVPTPDTPHVYSTTEVDGNVYTANRSGSPNVLAEFDLSQGTVVGNYEFSDGVGVLAMESVGQYVYFPTYGSDESLYCFDTESKTMSKEWDGGYGFCYDIDSTPDGKLYWGTYPFAEVYEYDVETRSVRNLGRVTETEDYVRTITATQDTIYTGTGVGVSGIFAIDRETEAKENIIPSELADSWTPTVLHTTDDYVIFQHARNYVAFLDRDNPTENWHSTQMRAYTVEDNTVYHASVRDGESGLYRYDPDSRTHTQLVSTPDLPVGDLIQEGQFVEDGRFVGLRFEGKLITIDMEAGTGSQYDLGEAGMRGVALTPQSISTYHEKPVVEASGTLYIHPRSMTVPSKFGVPGEAKVMESIEQYLYMGTYPQSEIVRYHVSEDEAEVVAEIGKNQLRPRDMHYQKATKSVLMGTKPGYGSLGGAISAYNTSSGDLITVRDVVADQSIRSITSIGETAYLGSEIYGEKADPVAEEAVIAAWDPETATKYWETVPVSGKNSVVGLTALDGTLYGVASGGTLFAVDPMTRETVVMTEVGATGELEVDNQGNLYGGFGSGIARINPKTLETETFVSDITPFGGETAINNEGYIYTVDADSSRLKKIRIK